MGAGESLILQSMNQRTSSQASIHPEADPVSRCLVPPLISHFSPPLVCSYLQISIYVIQPFMNGCLFSETFLKIFLFPALLFYLFCSFSFLPYFLRCPNTTFLLWEPTLSLTQHEAEPEVVQLQG